MGNTGPMRNRGLKILELEFPAGTRRVEMAGFQRLAGRLSPKEWRREWVRPVRSHLPYL